MESVRRLLGSGAMASDSGSERAQTLRPEAKSKNVSASAAPAAEMLNACGTEMCTLHHLHVYSLPFRPTTKVRARHIVCIVPARASAHQWSARSLGRVTEPILRHRANLIIVKTLRDRVPGASVPPSVYKLTMPTPFLAACLPFSSTWRLRGHA